MLAQSNAGEARGLSLCGDNGFIEGLESSVKAHLTELCFVSSQSLVGWQSLPHGFTGVYKVL